MRISDWSSDVCSSDLQEMRHFALGGFGKHPMMIFGHRRLGKRAAHRAPVGQQFIERLGVDHRARQRSEERRVGKECVSSVDLGGRRIIKKKKNNIVDKIQKVKHKNYSKQR